MKKAYYAHCMAYYDTELERQDIKTLERLGFEVFNPSTDCDQTQPEIYEKQLGCAMIYFEQFIDECDVLIFRGLDNGTVPSGVAYEIDYALTVNKPVLQLPDYSYKVLTRDQTKKFTQEFKESIDDLETSFTYQEEFQIEDDIPQSFDEFISKLKEMNEEDFVNDINIPEGTEPLDIEDYQDK